MVLYLAAMQNIPGDLYEAAELDGARRCGSLADHLAFDLGVLATAVFLVIGGMKAFEIICADQTSPTTDNHVVSTRMVQTMFSEFKGRRQRSP
jgi:ABC-type sugar transport system permease subunit